MLSDMNSHYETPSLQLLYPVWGHNTEDYLDTFPLSLSLSLPPIVYSVSEYSVNVATSHMVSDLRIA